MKRWICAISFAMAAATDVSAGSPTLTFNEAAVQFGAAQVHQSTSPKVIAISNTTNRPAFLTGINATDDFAQTLARADRSTVRVTNDEERARALIDDKRYSFEALLNKNADDIANAERVFSLTSDSERKLRIASILVSRGVRNPIYSNYLIAAAETALADASEFPWPFLYDERKQPTAPNLMLNDWCKAHNISFWDMEHVEYYEISRAWYFLAAAGDSRAYELLVKGLRSMNLMIAATAAHGLAKLQDPRAIDELIAAGHATTGEALWAIAESLIYFRKSRAQAAADELVPEKQRTLLNLLRSETSTKGPRPLFQW